ncbi:MAG: hypothetical protein CVU13_03315 [Bacteroidetes bacterium HGW-Bacteroidetes-8]|jgi:L-fuculose-phosphate aldolase|nr:MAG: hypothetical protein CVU13_03315 [Bacteroidetes bacterium HGW-Bacteroidetes-8]
MNPIPNDYAEAALEITEYSHLMWSKGYVEANGGNISLKLSGDMIISTPTMESKGLLRPEDMVISTFKGDKIYGNRFASSEIKTHIAVYRSNPEAKAVIHTHPPYTCSFAFTNSLPFKSMSVEALFWLDKMCIVPFIMPGSVELSLEIEHHCKGNSVILLRNHGLITWGESIKEAWWRTEAMESNCKISHIIKERGDTPVNLSERERLSLENLRNSYFNRP